MEPWGGGLCPCTLQGVRTNVFAACCLPFAYGYVQQHIDPNVECACMTFWFAQAASRVDGDSLGAELTRVAGTVAEVALVAAQLRAFEKMERLPSRQDDWFAVACCQPCVVGRELRYLEDKTQMAGGGYAIERPAFQRMTM